MLPLLLAVLGVALEAVLAAVLAEVLVAVLLVLVLLHSLLFMGWIALPFPLASVVLWPAVPLAFTGPAAPESTPSR